MVLNQNQDMTEVDELVSELRSKNIQKQQKLNHSTIVNIYKPGPYSIQLMTKSLDSSIAEIDNKKLLNYTQSKHPIKSLGENILSYERLSLFKSLCIFSLVFFVISFLLTLIISYIKKY